MFVLNEGAAVLETERNNYDDCFECILEYYDFLSAETEEIELDDGRKIKSLHVFVD
jgi:hypothetical protein